MRRTLATALLLASIAIMPYAHAQTSASQYYDTAIKPNFDAYLSCAIRHLETRAKSNPERTFSQVEPSLRPACGSNIDRARNAMTSVGMTKAESNEIIRKWYTNMENDIRGVYQRIVQDVNRQREVARLDVERERQTKETNTERKRLIDEAAGEHLECLKKEMVNIVPFSNEGAETLSSVVMTKCSDHERKRVSLAIALFSIPRSNAERILKEITDDTRKIIVAEIVTFRANQAKSQTEGQRSGQQPARAGQGI